MGRNCSVYFDTDVLRTAAERYQKASDELNEIRDELVSGMELLMQVDWRSKAADKLMEQLGCNWSKDVRRYCELVAMLCTLVKDAADKFGALEEDAAALRVDAS